MYIMEKKDNKKNGKDKKKAQKAKKLSDYRQSKDDEQLSFFSILDDDRQSYSNTIELYDAIPKYVWGKSNYKAGKFLDSIQREFVHKNIKYQVTVSPARLMTEEGEKEFLPGIREELVEDALRKLACDRRRRGAMLDEEVGVIFKLNELRRELKDMGHTFSYYEIKKAILVCAGSTMTLEQQGDANALVSGPLFNGVGLAEDEGEEKAFVRFNMLVTQGIKSLKFRQINYETCMSYRRALARWLHKRLSHNYVQAGTDSEPYSILHSTIVRDSGMKRYQKIALEVVEVKKTFEEMIDKGVLDKYHSDKIYDGQRKNKILDVKYSLHPDEGLIRDAVRANLRDREIEARQNRIRAEKFLENLREKINITDCEKPVDNY